MQELVAWAREAFADRAWHPLIVIGLFIVVFLEIHPFQDGNGRLSRALTTLLQLQAGYGHVPYSTELVRRGLLQRHGQGRGAWYGPPTA